MFCLSRSATINLCTCPNFLECQRLFLDRDCAGLTFYSQAATLNLPVCPDVEVWCRCGRINATKSGFEAVLRWMIASSFPSEGSCSGQDSYTTGDLPVVLLTPRLEGWRENTVTSLFVCVWLCFVPKFQQSLSVSETLVRLKVTYINKRQTRSFILDLTHLQ